MDKTIINDELELSFAVPGHSIPVITLLNANKDLLFIIEELSKIIYPTGKLHIEVLPYQEGSFKQKLKIILDFNEQDIREIRNAVIVKALESCFGTIKWVTVGGVLSTGFLFVTNAMKDKNFSILPPPLAVKVISNREIAKSYSHLAETLKNDIYIQKDGISFTNPSFQTHINRQEFDSLIIPRAELPSEETIYNIELISPVLTKSKAKWEGKVEDKFISFEMSDSTFKNDILHKRIIFQNGDRIIAKVLINHKDDFGLTKDTYRVTEVLYFNDNPTVNGIKYNNLQKASPIETLPLFSEQ